MSKALEMAKAIRAKGQGMACGGMVHRDVVSSIRKKMSQGGMVDESAEMESASEAGDDLFVADSPDDPKVKLKNRIRAAFDKFFIPKVGTILQDCGDS